MINISKTLYSFEDAHNNLSPREFERQCIELVEDEEIEHFVIHTRYGAFCVTLGEHALTTFVDRFGITDFLDRIVKKQLRNENLVDAIVQNGVEWDDEKGRPVPINGEGIGVTAAHLENNDTVVLYECGMFFINVRTVLKYHDDNFYFRDTQKVTVRKDGSLKIA